MNDWEIWSREDFEEYIRANEENLSEIAENLFETDLEKCIKVFF